MTLCWPAEPGRDLSGPALIDIVLCIDCIFLLFWSLNVDFLPAVNSSCICRQRPSNSRCWCFNKVIFTTCHDISFGKEVSWNGNYLVLWYFSLWPIQSCREAFKKGYVQIQKAMFRASNVTVQNAHVDKIPSWLLAWRVKSISQILLSQFLQSSSGSYHDLTD